jgi:hypothetical protein
MRSLAVRKAAAKAAMAASEKTGRKVDPQVEELAEFTTSLYDEYCRRQQYVAMRLLEVADQIHDCVAEELEDVEVD